MFTKHTPRENRTKKQTKKCRLKIGKIRYSDNSNKLDPAKAMSGKRRHLLTVMKRWNVCESWLNKQVFLYNHEKLQTLTQLRKHPVCWMYLCEWNIILRVDNGPTKLKISSHTYSHTPIHDNGMKAHKHTNTTTWTTNKTTKIFVFTRLWKI